MTETGDAVAAHLPVKPHDLELLLAVAGGPLHGYAMMQRVEEQSGGRVRLEVGSLYRVIARLLDAGLLAEAEALSAADGDGRRRRFYRLTDLGHAVVAAEVERLRGVLEVAGRRPRPSLGREG